MNIPTRFNVDETVLLKDGKEIVRGMVTEIYIKVMAGNEFNISYEIKCDEYVAYRDEKNVYSKYDSIKELK